MTRDSSRDFLRSKGWTADQLAAMPDRAVDEWACTAALIWLESKVVPLARYEQRRTMLVGDGAALESLAGSLVGAVRGMEDMLANAGRLV